MDRVLPRIRKAGENDEDLTMSDIALAAQTMFAELLQRSLDAEFDDRYDERGIFKKRKKKGRFYWHYIRDIRGKKKEEYVGPHTDKAITDRIARFADLKSDFRERQEMVRALSAAGVPVPDSITGAVVEALWKAGFFRLRGVLVGTVAYQCYAGLLGIRLSGAALMTQDADFAQFWGISQNVGDSMPPMLDVLRGVDATFREVPTLDSPFVTTQYRNAARYKVEFLTPNRGSDDHQGKPAKMPALGGAAAQPLRHLDFLIHQPERSVLLYKGGVPVTVPRAERYAVHKLIVAVERRDQAKAGKDVLQAGTLISALARKRPLELAQAWHAAWQVGPCWREKLESGRARLKEDQRTALDGVVDKAAESRKRRRRG
jgi:hypothetical protein